MELQNRPDWQLLAKYAAQALQGAVFVEIGTHLGDSALVMAEAAPYATIYTIDTGDRWVWEGNIRNDYIRFLLERFTGHKIYFIHDNSHSVAWPRWGMQDTIDLLFIDGDHSYDAVMLDLIRWAPKVKVDGYMLLHDDVLGELDKVYGALRDYIAVHKEWEILDAVGTMTALQKNP